MENIGIGNMLKQIHNCTKATHYTSYHRHTVLLNLPFLLNVLHAGLKLTVNVHVN